MTTRIYLVRHGETEWNARGLCQGSVDVGLNELGVRQAEALAETLRTVKFDAAYSSPLSRARQTADLILAGTCVHPVTIPELRELCYGRRQGSAIYDWPASDAAQWTRDPWSVTFPLGESLELVSNRVIRFLEGVLAAHDGDTVLVSAHGHVNRLILQQALQWPRDHFWSIDQSNGSCALLEYCPAEPLPRLTVICPGKLLALSRGGTRATPDGIA